MFPNYAGHILILFIIFDSSVGPLPKTQLIANININV
jgi:hypothetical protein